MIWLIVLLIGIGLSVPYWLGIAPRPIVEERRFLARMTLAGLAAGLLFNAWFSLRYTDLEVDPSQFLMVANGGAVGAVIGLVGMMIIRIRRLRRQPEVPPQ